MKCFEKDIKKHFKQSTLTALVNYDFKEIKEKQQQQNKQTNKTKHSFSAIE
jgi:hypothetical protein